jgi:hypothetical protein
MSTPEIEWDALEPRWLRFVIFYLVLRPLIARNKRLRLQKALPDKWYWADYLALQWGYCAP